MNDSNSLISHNKSCNTFMLINHWTIFEFPLYFAESKKKKWKKEKEGSQSLYRYQDRISK